MIKNIATTVIIASLLFAGTASIASAQETVTTTAASTSTVDTALLQARIQLLLKQIEDMKNAIAVQKEEIKTVREELKIAKRLKQGDQGDDVKTLQELLATDPDIYPEGKVTGVFGPLTAKAIRRFQEKNGLEGVGFVGPKTLEVLNRFLLEGGAGASGKIPPGLLRQAGSIVYVALKPQNDSGLKGYARIGDNANGKAVVRIQLVNRNGMLDDASSTRPAHIHVGACPTPGAVKYPLMSVIGGKSETVLDVSTKDLIAGLPLALNVHKSAEEVSVYVACGDLMAPTMLMKIDMDEKHEMNQEKPVASTSGEVVGDVRVITLAAGNFSFSNNEIHVKKGEQVKVALTVKNGFHDFVLDGLGVHTEQLSEGQTGTVLFTAPATAGTFEYYCSVGNHRAMGMKGKLIVE